MTPYANGRVPSWFWPTVIAVFSVLGVGFKVGAQVADNANEVQKVKDQATSLDFRLCRIEKALNISPYQTCAP